MHVTLQFHPDWPFADGTVIESMARDGVYRSQFETGTSNGGLTAHPGGDRWRWESALFGARYDDAPHADRPLYGALNRREDVYGGSVRFGSAHIRLRPDLADRMTFSFPDSALGATSTVRAGDVQRLVAEADAASLDALNDYVEAHVHARVRFDRDVEAVVLDPCFRGTPIEDAARRLGCGIEWHPGFRVATAGLDPGYRGGHIVELAQRLGAVLTPDVIGEAARAGVHDPQELKRVWHYLARFGRQPG